MRNFLSVTILLGCCALPGGQPLAECETIQPKPPTITGTTTLAADSSCDVDLADRQEPIQGLGEFLLPKSRPYLYLDQNRIDELSRLLGKDPAAVRYRAAADRQVTSNNVYAFAPWMVALLTPVTGDGKYCDFAVSQTQNFINSEKSAIQTFAAGGAKKIEAAHDSYLYIGSHVGGMARVYDWCYGQLTTGQKKAWIDYGNQAMFNLWNPTKASWGGRSAIWSGYSTNNPNNNYYYSFVEATSHFALATRGDNPNAAALLKFVREEKIKGQLLPEIAAYVGGGSLEGTGYGVSMTRMWRILDWWKHSTGEDLLATISHNADSIHYTLHAVVPDKRFIAPYGDHTRDSTGRVFDYHRDYLQTAAATIQDKTLQGLVKQFLNESPIDAPRNAFTYIWDYLYSSYGYQVQPLNQLPNDWLAETTGHIFSRNSWSDDAFYFSASTGPYTEDHDHMDKGSFLLYHKEWLAYDQNMNTHSGTKGQTKFHNLVNLSMAGTDLDMKRKLVAAPQITYRDITQTAVSIGIDTAKLYPAYGDVLEKNYRQMVFLKEIGVLLVYDQVRTKGSSKVTKTWQLNSLYEPSQSGGQYLYSGLSSGMKVSFLKGGERTGVADWSSYEGMRQHFEQINGVTNSGYRLEASNDSDSVEFVVGVAMGTGTLPNFKLVPSESDRIKIEVQAQNSPVVEVSFTKCCGKPTITD